MQILLLEFCVTAPIYSLPKWHGARWTAWLRCAARLCRINLEDLLLAIKPLRNGSHPFLVGEKIYLMLVLADGWHIILPEFLNRLAEVESAGEFSSKKLTLNAVYDYPDRNLLWKKGEKLEFKKSCFSESSLWKKMLVLLELDKWTIKFETPLRLPLPAGHPDRRKELEKYAPPEFMGSIAGLRHLLGRVRFMDNQSPLDDFELELVDASLHWEEFRYNRDRKMALGGVTGQITCVGRVDYGLARRLLAGELFGAGKNARFGLGYWIITELQPIR